MTLDVERVGFGPPLGDGFVDYNQAWPLQRQVHADVVDGSRPDTVLLLEHAPVYTAGKRTNSWERPTDGTPVVDVDRGGRITWHGPGQIVGYPITALADPIDVVAYVRRVEQLLIDVCRELGVDDRTGRRTQRRLGCRRRPRPRSQGGRDRRPSRSWRHDARVLAERRQLARPVPRDRPVRHRRRRRHHA